MAAARLRGDMSLRRLLVTLTLTLALGGECADGTSKGALRALLQYFSVRVVNSLDFLPPG